MGSDEGRCSFFTKGSTKGMEKKKKSPAPNGIGTYALLLTRRVRYRSATTDWKVVGSNPAAEEEPFLHKILVKYSRT